MKCPNCHNKIDDNAKFCGFCGNKFVEIKKIKKNDHRWIYILIGSILILSIVGVFSYYKYYIPYKKDKDAARKYIIANTYKLRSSRYLNDNDLNVVKVFNYGQEVLIYNQDHEWAEVKIVDRYSRDEYTGFFGYPKRYLCNKKAFYEIDGIYGNKEARKLITGSYSKTAILKYLHSNNFRTYIPENIQLELYKEIKNEPVWQVYGLPEGYKYNSAITSKLTGDDNWCLAVIISEKENNNNKCLLILSFDEENDNKGKLLYTENIGSEFDGIKLLRKGSKQHIGEKKRGKIIKSKLKYNAIELGSNNDMNENKEIIIYDGIDFVRINQK